ncbi:MAG: creatininase family protein [Candidatus Woesearchaeota archaeon]
MTWVEIEEKLKETQTVLIPISSLEQHGHHLPISTDCVEGYEVAKKAAGETKVLLHPTIMLGNQRKSYGYPGSISIKKSTLKSVVKEVCESLIFNGFKKLIFVSGHGGSNHLEAIQEAIDEMNNKNIKVIELFETFSKLAEELNESEHDGHAAESETSLMLYLDPKNVKMKKAKAYAPKYPDDGTSEEFRKCNPIGVNGDPTKATKEKGKRLFEKAVEEVVKIVKNE